MIYQVRVLAGKGVAFVRYKSRLNAEFAKEAMNCQSMDNQEVLPYHLLIFSNGSLFFQDSKY